MPTWLGLMWWMVKKMKDRLGARVIATDGLCAFARCMSSVRSRTVRQKMHSLAFGNIAFEHADGARKQVMVYTI